MKNILFPGVGLVGEIQVRLRKYHLVMSKTMNYFYENYLKIEVEFINHWSTNCYLSHNFIISDLNDRDQNLLSFILLFDGVEENGEESHVMALLKNNLQLKQKYFGFSLVPRSHKIEKFREEKKDLEHEPVFKKYEEYEKTIELLEKYPRSL